MPTRYYRVHWDDPSTFTPERASSAPWGEAEVPCPRCGGSGVDPRTDAACAYVRDADDAECAGGFLPTRRVPGYSCCESPAALVRYFGPTGHGSLPDDDERVVVEFSGRVVGAGPDLESLVIPDMRHVRWLTVAELRALAAREEEA